MLKLSAELKNINVISLRTGGPVALALNAIINPHNLKIIGWWCKLPGVTEQRVLLYDDVREITAAGLAINDEADIAEVDDLVRQKEILEINYDLIGKPVKTKSTKIGKVCDFIYNDGLFVQKLYVERPIHKVFSTEDTVIIDRNQILEVTDSYILVKETDIKARQTKSVPNVAAEAA